MNAHQVANSALKFLARCSMSPQERQEFGVVEQMLVRIAKGELTVGTPPKPRAKKAKEPAA